MTSLSDDTRPAGPPDEARHIHMPDYVLVFRDNRPPKEHAFTAISDDAAKDLMRKQYPGLAWSLYHVGDRGCRDCFYTYGGKPVPADAMRTAAAGTTA